MSRIKQLPDVGGRECRIGVPERQRLFAKTSEIFLEIERPGSFGKNHRRPPPQKTPAGRAGTQVAVKLRLDGKIRLSLVGCRKRGYDSPCFPAIRGLVPSTLFKTQMGAWHNYPKSAWFSGGGSSQRGWPSDSSACPEPGKPLGPDCYGISGRWLHCDNHWLLFRRPGFGVTE